MKLSKQDIKIIQNMFDEAAKHEKWIGIDLDGTIAYQNEKFKIYEIGVPIPKMIKKIKNLLSANIKVRIFTTRITPSIGSPRSLVKMKQIIEEWCMENIGQKLPITCIKGHSMIEFWDDKAISILKNNGETDFSGAISQYEAIAEFGLKELQATLGIGSGG